MEATKFVANWIWMKFEAEEPLQCLAMRFSLKLVADFNLSKQGEGLGTNN